MKNPIDNAVTMLCDRCAEDREFIHQLRQLTVKVRGRDSVARTPMLVCPVCGQSQPDHTSPVDSMQPFYDEYRRQGDLLTPSQIGALREKYALSQGALAALLEMSPATLSRYETGALQEEVHDQLLRLCHDPVKMVAIYQHRRNQLTDLQQRRFEEAVAKLPGLTRERLETEPHAVHGK